MIESTERQLRFVLSLTIALNNLMFNLNKLIRLISLDSLLVVSLRLFSTEIISKFEIFAIEANTSPKQIFA